MGSDSGSELELPEAVHFSSFHAVHSSHSPLLRTGDSPRQSVSTRRVIRPGSSDCIQTEIELALT